VREEADGAKREEESEKKRSRSCQFGLLFSRLSLPSLDSSIACRSLLDRREHDAATVTRTTSAENECGEREENEGDKRERERERRRRDLVVRPFSAGAPPRASRSRRRTAVNGKKRETRVPALHHPLLGASTWSVIRRQDAFPAPALRCRGRERGHRERLRTHSLSLSPSPLSLHVGPLLSFARSVALALSFLRRRRMKKKTSRSPTLALSSPNNAHGDKVHLSCSTFSGQREYERGRKREGGREGKGGVLPLVLLLRTTGVASLARGSFDAPINRRNKKTPLSPHSPRARARPCRRWERSDR